MSACAVIAFAHQSKTKRLSIDEETTMGHMLWRVLSRAIAAAALGLAAGSAGAQTDFPQRAITLIVPFAAGGPTDIVSRIVGDHISRTLGQPVIIENVVGAGGTTASTRAARATPDGYTIEMGHMGTHAASVALYPNLAYKPDADFAPIGLVAGTPVFLDPEGEADIGPVQRNRPGPDGFDRRAGRLHVRPDRQSRAAGGGRSDQGLCHRHARAQSGAA